MNKILSVILALALVTWNVPSYARITGTQPTNADVACWGPDGSEICVDASGNVVPTTSNDTTIGTSSLLFSNIYSYDAALSDDLTVADDATVTGDLFKTMVATQTVALSGTISVAGACGGILRLTSATDITVAGFTTPSSANAGCILYVINVAEPGGGTIDLATSATFIAPSGGVLVSGQPGVRLGTNDAIIIGNIGKAWVSFGTYTVNN